MGGVVFCVKNRSETVKIAAHLSQIGSTMVSDSLAFRNTSTATRCTHTQHSPRPSQPKPTGSWKSLFDLDHGIGHGLDATPPTWSDWLSDASDAPALGRSLEAYRRTIHPTAAAATD